MCYAYEHEYWLRRAEEIRKEMQKTEERLKHQPAPRPGQACGAPCRRRAAAAGPGLAPGPEPPSSAATAVSG
jgi:hypothetical protein